jgi:hypothetical protein
MSTDIGSASSTNNPKALVWIGRVLSVLIAAMMIMSAVMKFAQPKEVVEGVAKMGWNLKQMVPLGIVELAAAVAYLVPQTAALGAILLTGYLGGAIATHVRLGEGFLMPALLGVGVWLALFLRDARVRELLPLRRLP